MDTHPLYLSIDEVVYEYLVLDKQLEVAAENRIELIKKIMLASFDWEWKLSQYQLFEFEMFFLELSPEEKLEITDYRDQILHYYYLSEQVFFLTEGPPEILLRRLEQLHSSYSSIFDRVPCGSPSLLGSSDVSFIDWIRSSEVALIMLSAIISNIDNARRAILHDEAIIVESTRFCESFPDTRLFDDVIQAVRHQAQERAHVLYTRGMKNGNGIFREYIDSALCWLKLEETLFRRFFNEETVNLLVQAVRGVLLEDNLLFVVQLLFTREPPELEVQPEFSGDLADDFSDDRADDFSGHIADNFAGVSLQ